MGVRVFVTCLMGITIMLLSSLTLVYADAEIENEIQIDESLTRPTFGLSHDGNIRMVDEGFRFNNKTFTLTDNFHTPFEEMPVNLGEINLFEAKVYAEKELKVQEFLFGIPNKGEAHLAELGIEVWYGLFGEIEEIKIVQKSDVIDANTVDIGHKKAKCLATDSEENCDATTISMVFLEPLKDKVMAIKAIDNKNRYQITYLNDGFDISGKSLNSMATAIISSPIRNEGLIQLTQTEKYSSKWITEDEREFEKNDYGSFRQVNIKFERFQDSGDPKTRLHSEFGKLIAYEQKRATSLFDANELISELPDSFETVPLQRGERITEELKMKMLEQEQECLKYLEESDKQDRNY